MFSFDVFVHFLQHSLHRCSTFQNLLIFSLYLIQIVHHFISPIYGWMMLTWAPGGHHTLGGILNCCVHIIMYRSGSAANVQRAGAIRWSLGCGSLRPTARESQEAEYTQPRAHVKTHVCTC